MPRPGSPAPNRAAVQAARALPEGPGPRSCCRHRDSVASPTRSDVRVEFRRPGRRLLWVVIESKQERVKAEGTKNKSRGVTPSPVSAGCLGFPSA